jgi:hypothetical protein
MSCDDDERFEGGKNKKTMKKDFGVSTPKTEHAEASK